MGGVVGFFGKGRGGEGGLGFFGGFISDRSLYRYSTCAVQFPWIINYQG